MDIMELKYVEYIIAYDKLSEDEKIKLVNNPKFINCDIKKMLYALDKGTFKVQEAITNNSVILKKVVRACLDKVSKFNIFGIHSQRLIIKHPEVFLDYKNDELCSMLNSMPIYIYKECINNINKYLYDNLIENKNEDLCLISRVYNDYKNNNLSSNNFDQLKLNIILKTDETIFPYLNNLMSDFCNFKEGVAKRNILEIYKIDSSNQLELFHKFNLVVSSEIFKKENYEKYKMRLDLIRQLKPSHLNKIFDILKDMGEASETEIFITGYKMYCLFGLDNCLKILNNKFTYSNYNSIKRSADFKFAADRREYRIKHSDEFFKYTMIEKLKRDIYNNDTGLLRKLKIGDEHLVNSVFNELKEAYYFNKNDDKFYHHLSETLKYIINERENNLREEYEKKLLNDNIKDGKIIKREPLKVTELFNLFSRFDLEHTILNANDKVIMSKPLELFLLGNTKNDNDCLLRMVFNNDALDYNNQLVDIINNYIYILSKMHNNNVNNTNSLLNILDLHKIIEYELTTDEVDIPLSAISKMAVDNKFLLISKKERIDRLKEIYKESKKKYCSTIPLVEGSSKDGYHYKILTKNDEQLLTVGIDANCCFGPGSGGEDFFKYCLTDPNGGIIEIKDLENNTYVVPIFRNGNGVYGNGIEPNLIPADKLEKVKTAVLKCYNEIIKKSYDEEKIEFCTLSDLHKYINKQEFKPIDLDYSILNKPFYCDLVKPEIKNYVVAGTYKKRNKYKAKKMFTTKRFQNYMYTPDQAENKTIVEDKINEIRYRKIDCMPVSDLEKENMKNNFIPISLDNCEYAVCNEDWYIALSAFDSKSAYLPYDPRAKEECLKELKKLEGFEKIKNKIK